MWRHCHQTQLRLFPDAQADVFFHFWDTGDQKERWAIIDTMQPRGFAFETPKDYGFVDKYPGIRTDAINVPSRLVSQYMSWRKVATLFQPYAPRYDLAVRSRGDLYFHDEIRYDLTNVTQGGIALVAYRWAEDRRHLSDLFAVGKPGAIVYFHSLIDSLWDLTATGTFNAESLITSHILAASARDKNYAIFTIPESPFFVFRPHMVGWSIERCREEGPGASKWRDPEVVAAHQRYHAAIRGQAGIDHVERFAQAPIAGVTDTTESSDEADTAPVPR